MEVSTAPLPPPLFRDGFVAGLGSSLFAGLVLGLVDGMMAGGPTTIPAALGLWAGPVLAMAIYAGLVAGGVNAALGPRPLARLRHEPALDIGLSAALLAGAAVLAMLAVALAVPLHVLVVKAVRKEAGASFYPAVAVIAVVAMALLAVALQPLLRRVAALVPTPGRLPRTALVAAALGIGTLAWVRHRLYGAGFEMQALPVAALVELALLPVLTVVIGAAFYGPLAAARAKLPARGALVAAGAVGAVVLAAVVVRGQPSSSVAAAIAEGGGLSRLMVVVGQTLVDRDGDGYSAFFRGPDCDDARRDVSPGAKEIPANGIDENCQHGDAPALAAPPKPSGADLAAASAAGPAPAAVATPNGPRRNLLIIMVDTLRVDRLGASGYRRDGASISPNLDKFLGEATWFRKAYAQANNTPRSMPSFMASRYPSIVKVDKIFSKYPRVDDANDMLFERLQAAGYRTLGVTSHFYFRPERNFAQGFDEFDNDGALDVGPSNKDIAAPRIVARAEAKLAALAKSAQPFAMFVHLFEPHSSWMEHPGMPPITETGTRAHSQRYDYEIKFVDGWIATLLAALDQHGFADDTVVVFMSDHGESFGDHSFAGESMFHGTNLFDEQIRVPFAFRVPGEAPRQIDTVVQLLDLAPTVAALLGVAPAPTWLGRSLAPAIRGESLPPMPAFAELLAYPGWPHDIKMAVSGDGAWKLHDVVSQRRQELYELATDPREQRNLFDAATAKAKRDEMMALMAGFVDGVLAQ